MKKTAHPTKFIQVILKLPENTLPVKSQMEKFIRIFVHDTGNTSFTMPTEYSDLISWYKMAKEYFQKIENSQ